MKTGMNEELIRANTVKSLTLAGDAMQNPAATAEDFANYLEALCDVADGKSNFNEFAENTNLTGQFRPN